MARDEDETTREATDPEETSVADREALAETIVVDRLLEAETIVVDRLDGTLAVTRERKRDAPSPVAVPGGRRRRGMTMPPVDPGFGRGAVDAVGPGAVATYEPREIHAEPPSPPRVDGGNPAGRPPAPALPSVRHRSRRFSAVALAAFAVSCLVSVVGLVGLGVVVFGG